MTARMVLAHNSQFVLHRSTSLHNSVWTRSVRQLHRARRLGQSSRRSGSEESKGGGFLVWYSSKLDSHPILTKSISTGIIGGSGDVLSQYIESENECSSSWDLLRTARFGFLGVVLVGPTIHAWYGVLMRHLPGTSALTVTKRVALDQFIFSPAFVALFLSSLWTLEGEKSAAQVGAMLVDQMPSTIVANWSLWTPAQIINFRFVPAKYQVLFSNFVGLVWNAYLSYAAHLASKDVKKQEQEEAQNS